MRWKGRAGKLQRQWVWALDYNGNGDGWNQHRQSLRVWISDRPAVVGDWDEMERTSWNYKGNGVWALTHEQWCMDGISIEEFTCWDTYRQTGSRAMESRNNNIQINGELLTTN